MAAAALPRPPVSLDSDEAASELLGRMSALVAAAVNTGALPGWLAAEMRLAVDDFHRWLHLPEGGRA
jgi:hypothetical protein